MRKKDLDVTFLHHKQTFSSVKREFNFLQEHYGKCVGSSFRDLPNRDHMQVGWVFVKNGIETWVSFKPYLRDFKRTFHELNR